MKEIERKLTFADIFVFSQFISAHLDSVRNEIIKMSLFIEVGGLIMGFGAVVSGIFGMNLTNHVEVQIICKLEKSFSPLKLQEAPWAFLVVCSSIVVAMIIFFLGFTKK